MNVAALKAYNTSIAKTAISSQKATTVDKSSNETSSTKVGTQSSSLQNNTSTGNSEGLLTQKERDFFIKMFPDNSAQLEKHVLFNRNGKLQTTNIAKGQLVDGRV